MIQAGLYTAGSDTAIDEAISTEPQLADLLGSRSPGGPPEAFGMLRRALPASIRSKAVAVRRGEN